MIYTTRSINPIPINIPTIHAYTHFLTTHLFIYTMCLPSPSSILLFSSHFIPYPFPYISSFNYTPLNPFLSLSLHIFLTTFSLSTPHALHAHPFLTHLHCPFYFPYPLVHSRRSYIRYTHSIPFLHGHA